MWKTFRCWWFGHDHEQIVDYDARRVFQRCVKCGHEFQYDFQAQLTPQWIGFCDPPHTCPLCMGWKPRHWDRCANEVCEINPNGPLRLTPDGGLDFDLDARNT
jgi:hypothetical protein